MTGGIIHICDKVETYKTASIKHFAISIKFEALWVMQELRGKRCGENACEDDRSKYAAKRFRNKNSI